MQYLAVFLAPLLAGLAHATAVADRSLSITIGDTLIDPSLLLPGLSKCGLLNDILSPVSCHNHTIQRNTCCFNAPGGHFLQTQFWDYDSPTNFSGPSNSWTIHGACFLAFALLRHVLTMFCRSVA